MSGRSSTKLCLSFGVLCGLAVFLFSRSSHSQSLQAKLPLPVSPLQAMDISPSAARGKAVYFSQRLIQSNSEAFYVCDISLWPTGSGATSTKPDFVESFRSPVPGHGYTYGYADGCVVSPDHRLALLRISSPSSGSIDPITLWFWNFALHRLQPGPDVLLTEEAVFWSPDSRAIVYFKGDQSQESVPSTPLDLYIYDLKTRQSRFVASTPEARDMAWTNQKSVLYTYKQVLASDSPMTYRQKRPSIYEMLPQGGMPKLLIQDGSHPCPSPDGRWVAFIGWSQSESSPTKCKEKQSPLKQTFGLFLYNRLRKTRTLLQPLYGPENNDNLLWSADGTRLFSIQNAYRDSQPGFREEPPQRDYPGYGEGNIRQVDIPSLKTTSLNVITETDVVARLRPATQFTFQSVDPKGKNLFIYAERVGKWVQGHVPGTGNYEHYLRDCVERSFWC